MSSRTSDLYEFGPYRLDTQRRVFTREDHVVPLAPKTFELLLLLVKGEGRAFSKQELMTALWPDTFVEEANLSFQISVLRKALGEADSHWIETVPKHGYRLTADVKVIPRGGDQSSAVVTAETSVAPPSTTVGRTASGRTWMAASAALAAGGILAAAWYAAFVRERPSDRIRTAPTAPVPLTAYPGFENAPSLSPDGTQVAFGWNGANGDNSDVYVKLVGAGDPVRLTTNPTSDGRPAWSPTGGLIAFIRVNAAGRNDVYTIPPAPGGVEKRLAADLRIWHGLSWTPDGNWIAYTGADKEPGIWLIAADGSGRRQRLIPGVMPAFSPNGRYLAFVRFNAGEESIYVLPLTPELTPGGVARQVSPEVPLIGGLAWTPDSRGLVFSSANHLAGLSRLHRINLTPNRLEAAGPPELLPFGENGITFSISRTGRLVYSAHVRDANIWRLSLTGNERLTSAPLVSSSTLDEHTPDYSWDGKRLAFTSTRTGTEEIFVSDADGSNPVQMTSLGGPVCTNPRWSPDGKTIVFQSISQESERELNLFHVDTRTASRLTDDRFNDSQGSWSRDGRTIYYASNRTGRWEVWKMLAAGGGRTQITRQGGLRPIESLDGQFLYYAKRNAAPTAIWRVPVGGGEEAPVVDGLTFTDNFAVADKGLYFLAIGDRPIRSRIEFFEFKTGKRTTLVELNKPSWWGMALSPDQKFLLYSVMDNAGGDLMLVDNFQ